MKKILLFGSTGQMACEFSKIWSQNPNFELVRVARPDVDFSKPDSVSSIIFEVKPEIIVNAAAYTNVDLAEIERVQAMRINSDAVFEIGKAARKQDAFVIHFSTDYVFDGTKLSPYLETDSVKPINHYGFTKLCGDQALESSLCDAITLRVQWLYGEYGKNFYKTMQNLFHTKEQVSVVNDQTGVPTSSNWLANQIDFILKMQDVREKRGLYHLAPEESCTWFEFAKKIYEQERKNDINLKCRSLIPISTTEYPTPAKRPLNSILASQKWKRTFIEKQQD